MQQLFDAKFTTTCSSALLFLLFLTVLPQLINAECWYGNSRHEEGVEVETSEACLNCTCNRGVLLCYLRVCPKFPNPPPPGCLLVHRYRSCCPKLICPDFSGRDNYNALESRSEPDDDGSELIYDLTIPNNACITNGTIYAPGSAMDSSSLCEYCYCLGGKETCVKPKCLLTIKNCQPIYDNSNCCPVNYNCTHLMPTTTSTTRPEGGCWIEGIHHEEGKKVLGFGHSACDNCYCIQGVLRCEPLDCAPPLLGCKPVIKPGECCAASYNCSGTIETQPLPNYGQFPIVSKEYAKLIKANERIVTVAPVRTRNSFGTTRHFDGSTTRASGNYQDNTKRKNQKRNEEEDEDRPDFVSSIGQNIFSFFESFLNEPFNENLTMTETTTSSVEITTVTTTFETTTNDLTTEPKTTTIIYPRTLKSVLSSSDCITNNNNLDFNNEIEVVTDSNRAEEIVTTEGVIETTTEASSGFDDDFNDVRNVVTIFNLTRNKNIDYDYDYNEPTLPPSLPNLKIIPFVPADAVDARMDEEIEENESYEKKDETSNPLFGIFSPPTKTEGGFIPKQPPILEDSFYSNTVTPESEKPPANCVDHDGREVLHGESVPSSHNCITCLCLYGNIVCQNPTCPMPDPGCRTATPQDHALCCPLYICDDDPDVILLDRIDHVVTQKPIKVTDRDLTKTEAAPNLQSFISEMIPFLTRRTTPLPTEKRQLTVATTESNDALIIYPEEETQGYIKEHVQIESTTPIPVLINLAGCNIYGRMYRVGRIISELSGPCLECKCTEIGVQCKTLEC